MAGADVQGWLCSGCYLDLSQKTITEGKYDIKHINSMETVECGDCAHTKCEKCRDITVEEYKRYKAMYGIVDTRETESAEE